MNRADEPMAFVASTDADYYEWVCEGETGESFASLLSACDEPV